MNKKKIVVKEIKKMTEPNNAKTSIACPLRRSLHRKWAEASVKENGSREGANKKCGIHRKRAGEGGGGEGDGGKASNIFYLGLHLRRP